MAHSNNSPNNSNPNTRWGSKLADLMEEELQYLLLIPHALKDRGYGVRALPDIDAVRHLVRGERLEWIKERSKVTPLDLEALLGEKGVTALVVGTEYLAVCNPDSEQRNIAPNLRSFVVGNGVIFVRNPVTEMPVEMSYADFYTVLNSSSQIQHRQRK